MGSFVPESNEMRVKRTVVLSAHLSMTVKSSVVDLME